MARRAKEKKGTEFRLPGDLPVATPWAHLGERLNTLGDGGFDQSLDLATLSSETHALLGVIWKSKPELLTPAVEQLSLDKETITIVLQEVGSFKASSDSFLAKRRFLEVIDAGNQLGRFQIPIPYVPAPLPPAPPSPFLPERVEALTRQRPLIEAFRNSLDDTSPLSPAAWWGRLMFSAMLSGGLLRTPLLAALPVAVQVASTPTPHLSLQHRYRWLVLAPAAQNGIPSPLRFWYPDPVTRLQLAVATPIPQFPLPDPPDVRQIVGLLRAYARERGFAELVPASLSRILSALETRLHFHMPSWLAEYASDRLVAVSLPAFAHERLVAPPTERVSTLTERRPAKIPGDQSEDDQDDPDEDDSSEIEKSILPQLRQLGGVLHDRRDGYDERIDAWLAKRPPDRLPSVHLLGQWAAQWLRRSRHAAKKRPPRAVYRLVNSIGRRLVEQLGGIDLTQVSDPDSYVDLYLNAIEDTPTSATRCRVADGLAEFHAYLVACHDAPDIQASGVFNVGRKRGGTVDANFVSIDTFFRALNWLQREARTRYGKLVADQLELIAILGFFAGLRRSEALGLMVRDLGYASTARWEQGDRCDLWVEVNPNGLRGLKTSAATRQVPIHVSAPTVTAQRLVRWCQQRIKAAGADAPLFPGFIRRGIVHDTDPRLELITKALQHAADDSTLRFHHLRHSFASWMLLMLWFGEYGEEIGLPPGFFGTHHDQARLAMSRAVWRELLGRAPTNRRTVLQVSALMGHSGLDVTMGSYLHFPDLLLGRMVRRLTPSISIGTLAATTGYKISYLEKLARKMGVSDPVHWANFLDEVTDRILRKGKHGDTPRAVEKVDFAVAPAVRPPSDRFDYLIHFAGAISELNGGRTLQEVARCAGIELAILMAARKRLATLPAGIGRFAAAVPSVRETGIDLLEGPGQCLLARRGFDLLQRLWRDGDPPKAGVAGTRKRIRTLAQSFATNWIPGTYLSIQTEKLPDAKLWVWFLESLGLKDALVITHQASRGPTVPSAAKQMAYWVSGLKLGEIEAGKGVVDVGTRGRVRMDVDLRRLDEGALPYEKVTVLFGLRLALVLATLESVVFSG
jgi:integrase